MTATNDAEIIINEEALALANKSTLELKARLSAILDKLSQSNKTFCTGSDGDFSAVFGEAAMSFENKMREYIAVLNEVDKFAGDTLSLQTEQDAQIAASMQS
ncbi:MAG: hypothetical protein WC900_06295 [Oscillospiraceae bacterium]